MLDDNSQTLIVRHFFLMWNFDCQTGIERSKTEHPARLSCSVLLLSQALNGSASKMG